LARAFYDDPVLSWFFPEDSRRMQQLRGTFGYFGEKVWFPLDETYTTAAVAGAAVWMTPGNWRVGILKQLRMLPGMASAVGLTSMPRALRGFNLMESKHPHDPHYYLPVIGVEPDWQGKGLGTALLHPVLERCDRDKMPAYLEATSRRNLACYLRNGFDVTQEIVLPNGPPMWPMWRDPR
jgi:GNAT superfamily N-acetyltransferase